MPEFTLPLHAEPTGIPAIAFGSDEVCKVPPRKFAVRDSRSRLVCDGLDEKQAINVCALANRGLPYSFFHLEGDIVGRTLAVDVAYVEKDFAGDAATDAFRQLFAAYKQMLEDGLLPLTKKIVAKDFEIPYGFDEREMTLDQRARFKRIVDELVTRYVIDYGRPTSEFENALRIGIRLALAYAFRNIVK